MPAAPIIVETRSHFAGLGALSLPKTELMAAGITDAPNLPSAPAAVAQRIAASRDASGINAMLAQRNPDLTASADAALGSNGTNWLLWGGLAVVGAVGLYFILK